MGGVAIELVSAGLPVIVSERGGLAECVGDVGRTFPNGDYRALAEQMLSAWLSPWGVDQLQVSRILDRFDQHRLVQQYLDLYARLARP